MIGIGIICGETGTGKSKGCGSFEEPVIWFNLEDGKQDKDNRLNELIKTFYSDRIIEVHHLVKYHDKTENVGKIKKRKNEVDGCKTLEGFFKETERIMDLEEKDFPSTVIIDGISDLRGFAHEMWCRDMGRGHAVNPGDWSEVNDYVRLHLHPFVNFCKKNGITLVMTAQMRDNYDTIEEKDKDGKLVKKSVKAGRRPYYKEWEEYGSNFVLELYKGMDVNRKPTGKFYCASIKGNWTGTDEITGKNLYEFLKEKGI